ncbi:MAG: PAS domain S-box protein [Gemmatimonadaceae bacterium]
MTSATPDRVIDHGHEAKLRRIMESGIVGVFYWLTNGTITEANDAFLRMIGRDRADLESGKLDSRALTPPEWYVEDDRRAAEVARHGVAGPWEKEFFSKNGSRIPVFISAAVLDDNRETGVAVCIDITERRRMEEWLRLLSEALPVIVWTALPNGNLDHVGGRAADFFGISIERLLGEGWQIIIHPDDLAGTWEHWKHSLETGDTFDVEYRFRRYDGEYRWFLGRARAERDSDGNIEKWFGSCTEIHEQKRAEEGRDQALAQVERERQRLQEIFWQAPAMIAVSEGADHIFRVANPRFQAMVGRKRKLLGLGVREAFPDVEGQGYFELMDKVFATGRPFIGNEMLVKDMERNGGAHDAYFNVVYQPLTDLDGVVTGIMTHAVDVTAEVEARLEREQRTRELERLTRALESSNRELDQFAYAASHDLKAPLRGVRNLAQWIQDDSGETLSAESKEHLRLMHDRVQRMEALVDGMLAYARATKKTSPERVDVGRLVREVVELLDPPARITIHVQPNLPTVDAERVPFQQVVMNLLSNAIKHGRADSPQIDVGCADEANDYDFQIADNGPGIPPDAQDRIWEIFQTLESRDKVEGSGIGLAVVKRIIESHGGRAWVESVPGAGATFHFTWPKSAPQPAEASL